MLRCGYNCLLVETPDPRDLNSRGELHLPRSRC
jgi:hypothetical protein